jgi:hypothetical protein
MTVCVSRISKTFPPFLLGLTIFKDLYWKYNLSALSLETLTLSLLPASNNTPYTAVMVLDSKIRAARPSSLPHEIESRVVQGGVDVEPLDIVRSIVMNGISQTILLYLHRPYFAYSILRDQNPMTSRMSPSTLAWSVILYLPWLDDLLETLFCSAIMARSLFLMVLSNYLPSGLHSFPAWALSGLAILSRWCVHPLKSVLFLICLRLFFTPLDYLCHIGLMRLRQSEWLIGQPRSSSKPLLLRVSKLSKPWYDISPRNSQPSH